MDIKQIRSDYENGVVIGRETWKELIAFCEHSEAVIAGRQQKIGEQSFTIARLEQDCRDWQKAHQDAVALPRQPNNPAAHGITIYSDEFQDLLNDVCFAFRDSDGGDAQRSLVAHIDARLTTQLAINKSLANQLTSAEMEYFQLYTRLTRVIGEKPQWLPIETAPLDGSHVLCYAPELQFVGFYGTRSWCYVAPGVPVAPTQPTHWMPLSPAPAMSKDKKGGA